MNEKKCTKCGDMQPLESFHKKCDRKDGRASICKLCCKTYHQNKYKENKKEINLRNKLYRDNNKDKVSEYSKKYYSQTREHKREYERNRYANDSEFRMRYKLRKRLTMAVKDFDLDKTHKTMEYLGCDLSSLMNHLQATAIANGYTGFDIHDYDGNEYHIDHIIPFKAISDGVCTLEEVCHYSNLQVLDAKANLVKNSIY